MMPFPCPLDAISEPSSSLHYAFSSNYTLSQPSKLSPAIDATEVVSYDKPHYEHRLTKTSKISILADGLYPYENAFKICEENGCNFGLTIKKNIFYEPDINFYCLLT
jgi:hypothetical protein